MVFSNSVFLFLFLPISLIVYYLPFIKNIQIKNIWLLLVSLVFYAWGEPIYIFLMVLSIIVNYFLGRWVEKHAKSKKGKCIVALACVYNLGQLFFFKYLGWIVGLIFKTNVPDSPIFHLALPIGISFYTFQALSYVIDVYRGKDKAQSNILNVGLYIAFFPQLIAGPIVRYGSIAEQLLHRDHTSEKFADGTWRFTIGLTKKLFLANQLSVVAEIAFSCDPSKRSVVLAWVGALCFMLQIYFDFSGYSDMAIGLGKMFGFEFMENFNYPYISKSVTEYWRRWHISLGEWFRDYLLYPLSFGPAVRMKKKLNKKIGRKAANIIISTMTVFVVWLATGIWHGANLTFLVWGLLQFICITVETYRKPMKNKKLAAVLGFSLTFVFILLTKVIFNSPSMTDAIHYYGTMLALEGNPLNDAYGMYWIKNYIWFIIIGLIFIFPVVENITKRIQATGKKTLIASTGIIKMIFMTLL